MKKFILFLGIAIIAGTTAGWATNFARYGHRAARFGPITGDGAVTAENALAELARNLPSGLAKVELLSDASYDFGVMAPDEEGEHTFAIKNVGEEALTLRIGASTCKCTVGSLAKNTLAPGEETNVKLSWTVKTDGSEFSQSAQLLTNDPTKVVIDLSVSGRVVREMEMVPKSWSFGEVASGETVTLKSRIYNYMDYDIAATNVRFSSEEMTQLSDFQVELYTPSQEQDGVHAGARQAFLVQVRIRPGLRQGPVSQNFLFGFDPVADSSNGDGKSSTDATSDPDSTGDTKNDADEDEKSGVFTAATTGRIVGALSMIPNPKLTGREGGGYVYDFGRLTADDPMTAKAFVVLKGSQRTKTNLTVGQVKPTGNIQASLGQPLSRGSMNLYPLSLTLIPGKEPIERLGTNRDDYGMVLIESDNPAVPKMRIGVKFAIPAETSP